MASKKLPSWQFYPGDWMKDAELRSVSPAARGMWIDLLCLMFDSRRRGFLLVNGRPPTLDQIARMTGFLSTEEAILCLTELETSGVLSRTEPNNDGEMIIFNRRMVRDESKRVQASVNGKKGGNPVLVANPDNPDSKGGVKGGVNQKEGSSSSTSVKDPPSRARARVGEQGEDGEGKEPQPQPYEPPDIPKPLLDLAREVIGLTCDHILLGWMTVEKWPADWITKAVVKSSEAGKRGKSAVNYARAILQEWTKIGGPEKDSPLWASAKDRSCPGEQKPRPPAGSRVREMAIAQGLDPDAY